jgi:tetratricopeptide (TPR) repeat protein/thiol-disulfide isomerase/thioredoxin
VSRSATDDSTSDQDYYDSWMALYAMVRQGKSFSGHERNCFFLNMDGKEYADVSALSGLDYADDGRGIAVVDWDMDGRQDFWITNRGGPRVRLMRNTFKSENDFLVLRLQGTTSNRDAIGARVEVQVSGADGRSSARTLRAGESFLSQSSKWMHFGLGNADAIESVSVNWPGGDKEAFGGFALNGHYTLVQGSGEAAEWSHDGERVDLVPSVQREPESSESARIVLAARFPLPRIPYLHEDLSTRQLDGAEQGNREPLLVNLWATWCANCVVELRELTSRQAELKDAGLDILALSVDEADVRPDALAMLSSTEWPFQRGFADTETIEIFDFLPKLVVDNKPGLALPTSFLLDPQGRLAIIYHGPVDVDQLLLDTEMVRNSSDIQRDSATPFAGTWIGDPSGPRYLAIVRRLRALGQTEIAGEYLSKVRVGSSYDPVTNPGDGPELATMRADVAEDLAKAGNHEQAVQLFRGALELDPNNTETLNSLATSLRALRRPKEAVATYRQAIEQAPNSAMLHSNLGLSYIELRDPAQALIAFREAVRLNPGLSIAQQNLGIIFAQKGEFDAAYRHMRLATEADPNSYDAQRNFALLLQRTKRSGEAVVAYEAAMALNSQDPELLFNLANIYLELGNSTGAEDMLQKLTALQSPLADRLTAILGGN